MDQYASSDLLELLESFSMIKYIIVPDTLDSL